MPDKVFIHAFGCQMNKLDAELALSALRRAGFTEAAEAEEADVILYLTCSVREHAEERVYSNVGKLKRLKQRKPGLIIGILGCMAQKDGGKIFERLPHVDLVCGTREFPRIAELIAEARRARRVLACAEWHRGCEPPPEGAGTPAGGPFDGAQTLPELNRMSGGPALPERDISVRRSRRQAFVGIMRGCDNYCAYCVVPSLRGPEVSRPMREIVDETRRLVEDGCAEITLLGQNVNGYGKSFGKAGALAELLAKLDGIAGLKRLRFVTSHPKDMTSEILQAMRSLPSVCEHLHMPAQSGSDRILAAMNRKYGSQGYRDLVALAREVVPGIAIASDFIVGFPGETEAEFEETAALVRDVRFQNCFVFKYSPRPDTAAARLADDVPPEEKRRRNIALLEAQSAVSIEENGKFVGKEVELLAEGPARRRDGQPRLTGRLRSNHIVVFDGPDTLEGELVRVRIESATALTLMGKRAGA